MNCVDNLKLKQILTPTTRISQRIEPVEEPDNPCWRELTEMADNHLQRTNVLVNGVEFSYKASYYGSDRPYKQAGLEDFFPSQKMGPVPPEDVACWFLNIIKSVTLAAISKSMLPKMTHNGVTYAADIQYSKDENDDYVGGPFFLAELWSDSGQLSHYWISTIGGATGYAERDAIFWEILFEHQWSPSEREGSTLTTNEINDLFEIYFDWRE